MGTKVKVTKPTKVMPWEEFYEVTDNANKLMDRVWYCIACSDPNVGKQKIFWEHWYWKEDGAADKASLSKKKGQNHTKTIDVDGKEIDYPIWPLRFSSTSMKMFPAMDLGCCVITPIGISMVPLMFPKDDSKTEFRVDYAGAMKLYFIFSLDPHISEEDKARNYEKLEKEHGVKREWFHEIQWPSDYTIGSTGDPVIPAAATVPTATSTTQLEAEETVA